MSRALYYTRTTSGVHVYPVCEIIKQKRRGNNPQIIAPIPTWERLSTLETLIKDGRFVQALQMIGEIKGERN